MGDFTTGEMKMVAKVDRAHDDVVFLGNPDKWPAWPLCPVKGYRNGELVCGAVCEGSLMVVEGNIFSGWTAETYADAKKWQYDSFEAMVADGWEVD